MDRVIQDKERAHREEITSRDRQLRQLNRQLEEQEQVTAEIQQTNHSLRRQVEQLQQLSQRNLDHKPHPPQLQQQLSQQNPDHKPHPPKEWKVTLNWRNGGKAPFSRGAAVVEGCVAYFMHWEGQTCSYNSTKMKCVLCVVLIQN